MRLTVRNNCLFRAVKAPSFSLSLIFFSLVSVLFFSSLPSPPTNTHTNTPTSTSTSLSHTLQGQLICTLIIRLMKHIYFTVIWIVLHSENLATNNHKRSPLLKTSLHRPSTLSHTLHHSLHTFKIQQCTKVWSQSEAMNLLGLPWTFAWACKSSLFFLCKLSSLSSLARRSGQRVGQSYSKDVVEGLFISSTFKRSHSSVRFNCVVNTFKLINCIGCCLLSDHHWLWMSI